MTARKQHTGEFGRPASQIAQQAESHVATVQANAARLCKGSAAEYWQFPALGDHDTFTNRYKTL